MDVLDMAKMLGQSIAISNEMTRYKASEAAVEGDETALKLLADYKDAQIQLMGAAKEGKDEETLKNLKAKTQEQKAAVVAYAVTNEYLESKKDFDVMMKNINEVIRYAITGECSDDKCNSCGGGCKK
jgi:cell fate (sporulation/competence/biofilm development) regulator YlbF (YheA/YmcA/DUF963 family)